MNKKRAFIFALLLTLLILNLFFIFKPNNNLLSGFAVKERKTVLIARVIDGDTFVTTEGETIRLENINTPEKNHKGYGEATNYLKRFENETVELELTGNDKYNRILARVYTPEYLNLKIIEIGLGNKFLVNEEETKEFYEAEEKAIKNSLGIWEKSNFYECFELKINNKKEIVKLKNKCSKTNLKGWSIKDESRKEYKFQNILINEELNLHSENGQDNETDKYWNSKTEIWNDERDTAYLFDSESKIVQHEPYGY